MKKAHESRGRHYLWLGDQGAARQWCWDVSFHSGKGKSDRPMGSGSLRAKEFYDCILQLSQAQSPCGCRVGTVREGNGYVGRLPCGIIE